MSKEPEKKCNCPCHSPEFGGSYCTNLGVKICDKCGEPMEPEKKDVWEVEFENKFCAWNSKWTWAINSDANPQEVKNFIRQNFISRAEWREKVKDMKKEELWAGTDDDDKPWQVKEYSENDLSGADVSVGYNKAIDDLLDLLTQ